MAVLAIVGLYDLVIAQLMPETVQRRFPPLVTWLPHWEWSIWTTIALGVIVLALLEGAFRVITRRDAKHAVEVVDLIRKCDELASQLEAKRKPVEDAIQELERGTVTLGGHPVSMVRIFLWFSPQLLGGHLEVGSLFHLIRSSFESASNAECNTAEQTLMFKLRSLQLVHDEQRQHLVKGYTVIVTTSLGTQVVHTLVRRGWPHWVSQSPLFPPLIPDTEGSEN